MNLSDILGMVVQSGMQTPAADRVGRAMGIDDRASAGGLTDMLGGLSGGAGGLAEAFSGLLGGSGGGGIGGMLQDVLSDAGNAVGGNKNLALGGLAALAGALLGGKSGAAKGAVGGGLMALLGAMAFKALKGDGSSALVPLGLREPQGTTESRQLEQNSGLVLRAMLDAAKSDGKLDRNEMERILGQAKQQNMGAEAQEFLMQEMRKPIDMRGLCATVGNDRELAAQVYAASLLAIEVDTPAEQAYMSQLSRGLNLPDAVVEQLEALMGKR